MESRNAAHARGNLDHVLFDRTTIFFRVFFSSFFRPTLQFISFQSLSLSLSLSLALKEEIFFEFFSSSLGSFFGVCVCVFFLCVSFLVTGWLFPGPRTVGPDPGCETFLPETNEENAASSPIMGTPNKSIEFQKKEREREREREQLAGRSSSGKGESKNTSRTKKRMPLPSIFVAVSLSRTERSDGVPSGGVGFLFSSAKSPGSPGMPCLSGNRFTVMVDLTKQKLSLAAHTIAVSARPFNCLPIDVAGWTFYCFESAPKSIAPECQGDRWTPAFPSLLIKAAQNWETARWKIVRVLAPNNRAPNSRQNSVKLWSEPSLKLEIDPTNSVKLGKTATESVSSGENAKISNKSWKKKQLRPRKWDRVSNDKRRGVCTELSTPGTLIFEPR